MNVEEQISKYCSLLRIWNSAYEEYAKSIGLSYTSLLILQTMYGVENCTQKILCEQCFLPKQTVNITITSFYKQGLISLKETPEDRRTKTIHFTTKGEQYAKKILGVVKRGEIAAMNSLLSEQRDLLLQLTDTYVKNCITSLHNLAQKEGENEI